MGIDPEYRQAALGAAIAAVRRNRGCPDTAELARHRNVREWLTHVAKGDPDKVLNDLVLDARVYLQHDQPELLARLWIATVDSLVWSTLPPSAKWLYRLIHAVAQETDGIGGQRVLMSNRAALRAIAILGGPAYRSLGIVTAAREQLVRAGLVTVDIGQQWERGKRSVPTRYILPLEDVEPSFELSHPGNRDSSKGSWEPVPTLTRDQRAALDEVFQASKATKDAKEQPTVHSAAPAHQEPWEPTGTITGEELLARLGVTPHPPTVRSVHVDEDDERPGGIHAHLRNRSGRPAAGLPAGPQRRGRERDLPEDDRPDLVAGVRGLHDVPGAR